MEIVGSARKHGLTDDQIRHALRNTIRVLVDPDDESLEWWIGPDDAGQLLELLVVDEIRVIHAMPCRAKFLPR